MHYLRQFASQPRHKWHSPILVLVLSAVFYGSALIAQFTGFFIWALIFVEGGGGDFDALADSLIDFNTVSGVVNGLVSVILMWPAVELATFCVYRRWFWSMISAKRGPQGCDALGRGLRWSLLGRYLLLSLPVWVISVKVMALTSDGSMGDLLSDVEWNQHVVMMLLATIVLVPFQAASEEIVFRGLAMNIIGSWLKHPAWAVLIPVPFFVYGHLYDLPGLVDVGIFAVIMGVLTLCTGGLEAGIAFHIVNNLFAFGLGILTGADLNARSSPTNETVISIAAPIAFACLVVLDMRGRRRTDTADTGHRHHHLEKPDQKIDAGEVSQ